MSVLKRIAYMGLGALLLAALVVGGAAVLAQDDGGETPEDGTAEDGPDAQFRWPFRARGAFAADGDELLAEALGISVEELEAAYEAVRLTVIDQALEEGVISEEEAEILRENQRPMRNGRVMRRLLVNGDELLADALGIGVDELQEARAEVRAARLEELVDAGVITQERADLLAAREVIAGYVDREGLAETLQNAYEAAIDAALADGAITQEQADQLLENMPSFESFGFGGPWHRRGHAPGWDGAFAPDGEIPAVETLFDA